VLSHPGRYADITPSLRAKEVVLGEGERMPPMRATAVRT
jgi:hypothetical protein